MPNARKLPSGNYRCRIKIQGKTYSFTAETKREAERMAAEYVAKENKPQKDKTLQEAYISYIKSHREILSPRTYKEYAYSVDRDFQNLMHKKVSEITTEDVQREINESAKTLAPKTLKNKMGLLRPVLTSCGCNIGSIKIQTPKKVKSGYKIIPSVAQVDDLINNANEFIRVPIILAAYGSCRRSETCALTPKDILDDGIRICKAKVESLDGQVIKGTKTDAGDRYVPIAEKYLREIREWEYFGCSINKVEKQFHKLCLELDIPTTYHKLRHFFVTTLFSKGIDAKTICSYSGHESVQMIYNIYAHSIRDEELDSRIKGMF